MSQLFSPVSLGKLTLPNRIIIAPMCQYSADEGKATAWHTMHLGNLSHSGAGLLIIEATSVAPEGRISPKDLGLWDDVTEQALAPVIQAVKRYSDMPLGIQLAHAGRKASTDVPWGNRAFLRAGQGGWQTVAPSAIPYNETDDAPLAMSQQQIRELITAFVESARRADRLGFDLIELHAAHGYLLHQFLSPLANQRTDEYGGLLQNRQRLLLEVYRAVRDVFPAHKAVGVRISATDGVDGGWDLAQSLELSKALHELGCDFIHVSSGGMSAKQEIHPAPNYQVPYAQRIKQEVGITTIAVGLITEPEQAEAIVATGEADAVGLARAILFNPRWPWHAAVRLGAQVSAPPQYWRSEPRYAKNIFKQ
ncbi:2,4-dienoyl-CoA reductase-like NADH-dependent reductase (Old Yellow Enzyme family)|uniref:2,4-dienoyl-CoA reductase-like NADH-dependent reductase (Old Yellow Enzyme family) n=2 Tax=Enterobacterales TaxID=91347 RepID=A0A366I0F6_9GAMM|nr:NADH:flavin oxidoreductase/NADH oxidase [Brenneria salicis]NMN91226.1 2,4-dienoyl-CoA reductase-like NADH-dependent reductase (Old Yellow Enzyme family) [Brenneria salicis ATCC 15712 = DSM 30166]RBP60445.1 2,4-dienoyl-CoA reductase-like NADH-dependent reductase (Old Yellow Enzyme family) [Brenneria salicis ATCC 15712 = DSM 30166]RLM30073.1 oxidoreductase [Brenneria salicis ATCC 15712 = DSM 30166]